MKEYVHFYAQTFTVVSGPGSAPPGPGPGWRPPIDVYECKDRLLILVDLPGIDRDRLSVTVEHDVLTIAGYREKPAPPEAKHVHQMEIPCGHFSRQVRLPRLADVDAIKATYENGYLTVNVPRKKSHERR
jgi:HSP20 family protein